MIIRRNLYNMLFGYYVFLRRCESDYLHQKPPLNAFRGGFSISYPKSYPENLL